MKYKILISIILILFLSFLLSNYITQKSETEHNTFIDNHLPFWHKTNKLMIMSYNIRSSNIDADKHKWSNRKKLVAETLNHYRPDIISTQEGLKSQLLELRKMVPGYGYYGILNDIKAEDENLAIFYNIDTVKLIKSGHFWLSETPDISNSKSWNMMFPRMVTYIHGVQISKNKQEFIVINTHFDHDSTESRVNSSKLIIKKIKELFNNKEGDGSLPIFITGDFNEAPSNPSYNEFILNGFKDSYVQCSDTSISTSNTINISNIVTKCYQEISTASTVHFYYGHLLNNFIAKVILYLAFRVHSGSFPTWGRYHIDWILYLESKDCKYSVQVLTYHVINDLLVSDIHPSDHYPVLGVYDLNKR